MNNSSDGSDPRIGPGSAQDWPFLKGLRSDFREGPKLGIGSGLMSRIKGPKGIGPGLAWDWPGIGPESARDRPGIGPGLARDRC